MRILRHIRIVLLTLLILSVALPATMYVLLSTGWANEKLRSIAQTELSRVLDTRVEVGRLAIAPFNRLKAEGISVYDNNDSTVLYVSQLSARFELIHFLRTGDIVIDYVRLSKPSVHIYRTDPSSPLNIDHIVKALKGKDENKPPSHFDLAIENIIIEDGDFRYDILSQPTLDGRFDKNHLAVNDLSLIVSAPKLSDSHIFINLDKLSMREKSGLTIDNITSCIDIKINESISISRLNIALPNSLLSFEPLKLTFDEIKAITSKTPSQEEEPNRFNISLLPNSHVTPSDLSAFAPELSRIDTPFNISLDIACSNNDAIIKNFEVASHDNLIDIMLSGHIFGLDSIPAAIRYKDLKLSADVDYSMVCNIVNAFSPATASKIKTVSFLHPSMKLQLQADGSLTSGNVAMKVKTPVGDVIGDAIYDIADLKSRTFDVDGTLELDEINMEAITRSNEIGNVDGTINFNIASCRSKLNGDMLLDINHIEYNNNVFDKVFAEAHLVGDSLQFKASIDDEIINAKVNGYAVKDHLEKGNYLTDISLDIHNMRPDLIGIKAARPAHTLSGRIALDGMGRSRDDFIANLIINDLCYTDSTGSGFNMKKMVVDAKCDNYPMHINIESDYLNGSIEGTMTLSTLPNQIKELASTVFPQHVKIKNNDANDFSKNIEESLKQARTNNDFIIDLKLSNGSKLSKFFNLPVDLAYPIALEGAFDYANRNVSVNLDAPYMIQGDKVIDNTVLIATLDGKEGNAALLCTTHMPTKKGPMGMIVNCTAGDNSVVTDIDWEIERAIPLNGKLSFTTDLINYFPEDIDESDPKTGVIVTFAPGTINFGNDIWNIAPSQITYINKVVDIDNFDMVSETQSIHIDGSVGDDDSHLLRLDLKRINLIDIFENLEIDNALIGGYATGTVRASRLLSGTPDISTEKLHVDDIGYNHCTLGDAEIDAFWDNERKSFHLDADIVEPGGQHSRIFGDIMPSTEELDIYFDANHVKVGFMQPFMKAFASNISGYASGKAHLFGSFKYIDLEGDIFAESLRLRIDFTNTYYSATDSIHIDPGRINIKDITITDEYGNTALLNGTVTHTFFKEPVFDFAVTNARNFLSYNVTAETSPIWYGRIFGNGAAFIKGEPGIVDIRVDMATAPNSTFTFVLSDDEIADEYSFITFRERPGLVQVRDSIIDIDSTPDFIKRLMAEKIVENEEASDYRMDIQVDITPEARIILVMDPVGGDEIRANGKGNLQMKYSSQSNLLTMYGLYTLEKGTYNFTLQDIIIKDFTIREGSSVAFNGSPYDAQLNIEAIYNVNANLSDLDESFTLDKELNRTTVPVHAVLKVSGSMTQPDINFDLEFPTLTSDTYRKVRSIISTEDMMSRQIIYLLALNRFYTPEYMNGTKGNALFSVASSTISSQISSMLGKLSENWSIAPNLRSERGDFSDLEVDVALSSSLLNNRLIINGNFGYRDKSMNRNQFVGDFDTELLLNKRGTWRLKGYNHYNDQNLYLRSAATTQGLGLMFRRDYDGLFSFLKPIKNSKPKVDDKDAEPDKKSEPNIDETLTQPVDSVETNNESVPIK